MWLDYHLVKSLWDYTNRNPDSLTCEGIEMRQNVGGECLHSTGQDD